MFHVFCRFSCMLFVVSVLVTATSVATAKSQAGRNKSKSASSVRFIDAPSSESAATRQARLKRECRGRPNAGACLGMTAQD